MSQLNSAIEQIGSLIVRNAELGVQVEKLEAEVAELKRQLSEALAGQAAQYRAAHEAERQLAEARADHEIVEYLETQNVWIGPFEYGFDGVQPRLACGKSYTESVMETVRAAINAAKEPK
jgi:hypothetical protein